jgi:hypothetical protein
MGVAGPLSSIGSPWALPFPAADRASAPSRCKAELQLSRSTESCFGKGFTACAAKWFYSLCSTFGYTACAAQMMRIIGASCKLC